MITQPSIVARRIRCNGWISAALLIGVASSLSCSDGPSGPVGSEQGLQTRIAVEASVDTARMISGTTLQLTAAAMNPAGRALPNDRHMRWFSSNPDIASVDGTGMVTAADTGVAFIIVTHMKRADSVRVHVVPIPVATVSVQPASLTLDVGEPATVTATALDSHGRVLVDRVITWSTDAPGIAQVVGGVVTGVAPGSAVITATAEGKEGQVMVTVLAPWFLTPTALTLDPGQSRQLEARRGSIVLGGVDWSTNNPAVAIVSETGYVTAIAPGVATISARWGWLGSLARTATVTVRTPIGPVNSVTLPDVVTIDSMTYDGSLLAQVRDASGNDVPAAVTWVSLNPQVAIVGNTGSIFTWIRGISPGTARVVATADGKSDTATVVVPLRGVGFVIVEGLGGGYVSQSGCPDWWPDAGFAYFSAYAVAIDRSPLPGRTVSAWTLTPDSLVSVLSAFPPDPNKLWLLLRKPGTTRIAATIGGRSSDEAGQSALLHAISCTRVTLAPATAALMPGETLQLATSMQTVSNTIPNPAHYTGTVWLSSNPSVGSVSSVGIITAHSAGQTIISATAFFSTGTMTVTVSNP